jgi:hypothetical protein
MKLLVELDEEYVKVIDEIKFLVGGRTNRKLQLEVIKAIKNGIPLEQEPVIDKIRAEIDKIYEREGNSVDCLNALNELKWFIDKYKAESESQKSED